MVLSKLWQIPKGALRDPVVPFFAVEFTPSVTRRSVAR